MALYMKLQTSESMHKIINDGASSLVGGDDSGVAGTDVTGIVSTPI